MPIPSTGCAHLAVSAVVLSAALSATNAPSEQSSGECGWCRNHNVRVVQATRLLRPPNGCTLVFQLFSHNDSASRGACGRGQAIITIHHSSYPVASTRFLPG
ncbi:hypothetical protein C7T79_17705 [Xanthomonas oryzae pv. oryzicola]|nr:hypothetical protein C7T79_17705 [Xanthomonas oryzae pv. oryzicola]